MGNPKWLVTVPPENRPPTSFILKRKVQMDYTLPVVGSASSRQSHLVRIGLNVKSRDGSLSSALKQGLKLSKG